MVSAGNIIQIIGVISIGIGSILAITKLWQGYIEESKRRAVFWIKCQEEFKKYKSGSPESEKTDEDIEKIILKQIHFEKRLVYTGITLIIIGVILQIAGTMI